MIITSRLGLMSILCILMVNPILAQQRYEYITDWPGLFFSNINLMSAANSLTFADQPQKIKFSSSFTINDFYRARIEPDIERSIISWVLNHDFQFPLKIFNTDIILGAHIQSYEKNIDYEFNPQESLRIKTVGRTYSLSVSTQPWTEYVDLSLNLGQKNLGQEVYSPWSIGLGFNLNNILRIRYDKFINYFDWDYRIEFTQPAIQLSVPEKADLDQLFFSSRINPRLEFKAMLQINTLNNVHSFDKSRTTLLLHGDQYRRWLSISFKTETAIEFSFNYYDWRTGTDGYFYDQGLVFGKFTKREEFSETFSPQFGYHGRTQHLGIYLAWGKGEITDRGHLESWPFTSTWVDLLGLRYYLDSRLDYRFMRSGGSYTYFFPSWQIGMDICGERISPAGETRTWEPEIIGIGIKNLMVYQLSSKKRDGIYLGLNLGKKFWQFIQISYQFNQYIPVDFSRTTKGKHGGTSTEKRQYGGGKHLIEIILYL